MISAHHAKWIAILLIVTGCSTPYKEDGILGGYDEYMIDSTHYRVGFQGNGYTTSETVQTYWLYRCAELALEKGATGFEITSDMRFVKTEGAYEIASSGGAVYVPVYTNNSHMPKVEGDIILLQGAVVSAPPRVFNAAQLKSELEPHVKGKKCGSGNVCPHLKGYLGRR